MKKHIALAVTLKNKFNDIKLPIKFLISFLFIVSIPILLGSLYIFNDMQSSIVNDATQRYSQSIIAAQKLIDDNSMACRNLAISIAGMKKINDYAEDKLPKTFSEILDFKATAYLELNRMLYIHRDISNIRILSPNKVMHEIPPLIIQSNIDESHPAFRLISDNLAELWLFDGKETGLINLSESSQRYVSYYYNKKRPDGESKYVIEIKMPINEFFPTIEEYTEILINSNIVIGDIKSKLLLEELTELTINNKNIIITKDLEISKDKKLVFIKPIDGVTQQIDSLRINVILISLISMTVFANFVFIITKILLCRMYKVIDSMKKVENGDLFVICNVHGNDEIAELSHGFNEMTNKLIGYINLVILKQAATKDAEIRALHSQINSHFIYNVLDAIKVMAEQEYNYDVADALISLSRIMRYNADWRKKYVLLKYEINYIEDYIDLMNVRYGGKLKCIYNIDADITHTKILKMLIQPIVENSIKHGIANRSGLGTILLKISDKDNIIDVTIADNGIGISEERVELINNYMFDELQKTDNIENNRSIGMKNIYDRLRMQYNGNCSMNVKSKVNFYTSVELIFPKSDMENNNENNLTT